MQYCQRCLREKLLGYQILQVSENCILKRFKPFKTADVRVADLNISFELGFDSVLEVRSFKRHRGLDAVI